MSRNVLTFEQKLKIVDFLRKHDSGLVQELTTKKECAAYATQQLGFNISEWNISDIIKSLPDLKWTQLRTKSPAIGNGKTDRTTLLAKEMVTLMQSLGVPPSDVLLALTRKHKITVNTQEDKS